MANEKAIQHVLDLARAEINRQQPHLALAHLKTIWSELGDLEGTPLWAEAQLTYAEALAALRDPGAMAEFEEAVRRISSISESDLGLEMRAHEHFAKYLAEKCAPRRAREHYQVAERSAVNAGLQEDADRVHLCIIRIDLESAHDPQLGSFQNLKKAAAQEGSTHHQQLAAWMHYLAEVQDRERGLLNARQRGVASVDYFLGVLSLIGNSTNEIAD